MADILGTFRQKAEDLISAVNSKGGIQATLEGLRRQMAEADRRRAMSKVRSELKRLDAQINEMIMAVGVQAVGLQKAGRLSSPELQPLCEHIVELEAVVEEQRAELRRLEAMASTAAEQETGERHCPSCGQILPPDATFCPYCGAEVPPEPAKRFCIRCGTELRPDSRFCSKCGEPVAGS